MSPAVVKRPAAPEYPNAATVSVVEVNGPRTTAHGAAMRLLRPTRLG